jgi:gamma-glutamylcyclotransferase (GGCT)/AIG2-like uncharacterized protein YtfP
MYFAYGHNTDTAEFKKRIPKAVYVGTATLYDYKLVLHRWAGIEKSKGDKVVGVVWKIPKEEVKTLDGYEGLGKEYKRSKRSVVMKDGSKETIFVYELLIKPRTPPTQQYVRWLRKGYKTHRIPLRQLNDALSSQHRGAKNLKRATLHRSYSRRG